MLPLLFQCLGVTNDSLIQQILQGTSIFQAPAYLRHQLLRNINGERAPLDPARQEMARVFFTGTTGLAVFPYARASPHAEATETSRQDVGQLVPQPPLNIQGRFGLAHCVRIYNSIHTCQGKSAKLRPGAPLRVSRQKLA